METGDTEMKRKRTEKEKAFLRNLIEEETRAMISILEEIKSGKVSHYNYHLERRLQTLVNCGCLKYHPSSKYVFHGTFTFIRDFDKSFFVQP